LQNFPVITTVSSNATSTTDSRKSDVEAKHHVPDRFLLERGSRPVRKRRRRVVLQHDCR
jgi:hypothetical protein